MFTFLKDSDYQLNGEEINLSERNFRMAVTIEDFYSPSKQKNDKRYVKWLFRLVGKRDGVMYQHILKHHKCTDEDYKEFYPIQK